MQRPAGNGKHTNGQAGMTDQQTDELPFLPAPAALVPLQAVRCTEDGLTALDVLQEYQAELVLLDIGLPRLAGLEVARRIRQLPQYGDIVLAAMTGYGQDTDRQRSKLAGFDHHLVKPTDFGDLGKTLKAGSKSLKIMTVALSN